MAFGVVASGLNTSRAVNELENQTPRYGTFDPFAQEREQMLPLLNSMYMNSVSRANNPGRGFASYLNQVGGGGGFRSVNESPIWDANQVQSRVNSGRALNDAQTENQVRKMQDSMAQRGYSSSSPLLMHMSETAKGVGGMGNATMENETRWNAALGNAQHVQQAQMANASNWQKFLDNELNRRQLALSAYQGDRNRPAQQGTSPSDFMSQITALLGATRPQQFSMGQTAERGNVILPAYQNL